MNRIIKFRAKSRADGRWYDGDLHTLCDEPHIHTDSSTYPYAGKRQFIDADTIGQFTGLCDCKGVEIYEGDILRVKEYENQLMREFSDDGNRFDRFTLDEIKGELRKEYVSPVCWEEGTFCISTKGDYNDMFLACLFGDMKRSIPIFDFVVIGNIYDNPELLEKK